MICVVRVSAGPGDGAALCGIIPRGQGMYPLVPGRQARDTDTRLRLAGISLQTGPAREGAASTMALAELHLMMQSPPKLRPAEVGADEEATKRRRAVASSAFS